MSKKVWVWAIVVVVAALAIWQLPNWFGGSWKGIVLTGNSPSPTPSPSPVSGKKASPAPGLTYDQALATYAGNRIQFNEKCQAIPGQMALKNGTKIMLDNRSKYDQTVSLEGMKVALPGYSWQVVTIATKSQLPYSFKIDCQSQGGVTKNSAVINLQALIGQ